ncbi:MAG TPA: hypothetical protein VF994_10990 [Myxococcales bacterium]
MRTFCRALAAWALAAGCARVELPDEADGGTAGPPRIADLQPPPGAVEPEALFHVVFSEAMDEGVLLASTGRSETVVLAPDALVERAAAAIEHSRLSAEERSLLVAARASISAGAAELDLAPEKPLLPGGYWLLASTRLKDAAGHHLQAAARFHYSVTAAPAVPALIAPPPGSTAAANLSRVRISVPEGGGAVSVVGPSGAIASAAATRGVVELPLCPAWAGSGCTALKAGETYSLALDGKAVPGGSFTAGQCPRLDPPSAVVRVRPRDTSIVADVRLDWPARVAVQIGTCPGPFCGVDEAFASCAPDPCTPPADPGCAVSLRVDGLLKSTPYALQLLLEDDEGHLVRGPVEQVMTTGALPRLVLSEVMASPPLPAPRSDGEYVEILNAGTTAADLSGVALEGGDGIVRPVAPGATGAIVLLPGTRALAVGASFDAGRYTLPAGVPVLRASTQRLLGRGLSDESPPLIALLASDADGGMAEVDRYPGAEPRCPVGQSIEAGAGGAFVCGADGGSPGRPP